MVIEKGSKGLLSLIHTIEKNIKIRTRLGKESKFEQGLVKSYRYFYEHGTVLGYIPQASRAKSRGVKRVVTRKP